MTRNRVCSVHRLLVTKRDRVMILRHLFSRHRPRKASFKIWETNLFCAQIQNPGLEREMMPKTEVDSTNQLPTWLRSFLRCRRVAQDLAQATQLQTEAVNKATKAWRRRCQRWLRINRMLSNRISRFWKVDSNKEDKVKRAKSINKHHSAKLTVSLLEEMVRMPAAAWWIMSICSINLLDPSHPSFNEEKTVSLVVRISSNLPIICGRSPEEPASRLHLSEIRGLPEVGTRLASHPSRNISTGIRLSKSQVSTKEPWLLPIAIEIPTTAESAACTSPTSIIRVIWEQSCLTPRLSSSTYSIWFQKFKITSSKSTRSRLFPNMSCHRQRSVSWGSSSRELLKGLNRCPTNNTNQSSSLASCKTSWMTFSKKSREISTLETRVRMQTWSLILI